MRQVQGIRAWAGVVLMAFSAAGTAAAADGGGAGAADPNAGKPHVVISDFQDAKDLAKWDTGDAGATVMTREPRAKTDANFLVKVVFKSGDYPGFSLKNVPADWSAYEAISWTVYAEAEYTLQIRIDDGKSHDYKSQFNKTIKLDKGDNLCQIKIEEIERVLDAKDLKRFILFTAKPPAGLTMWFDNVELGALKSEQVPFIPYAERMDMQPTLTVATPHFEFGRNLASGPLKAFVMSGIRGGREVPELMERLDMQVSLQTWDRDWDINTWGMGDFYGKRGHAFDRVLMQKYFASSMQGPEKFDVIVMPTPIGWKEFSPAAREALIKRVNDGAGLVLVMPFPGEDAWPDDLKRLSALINSDSDRIDPASGYVRYGKTGLVKGSAWKAEGAHAITAGVPFEAMPFARLSYQKYELAPGATAVVTSAAGDPVVAVRQVGKGRVVTCAWRGSPLLPDVAVGQDEGAVEPYRYWEPLYSLMSRAICWAGQREFAQGGAPVVLNAKEQADPNLSAMVWKDAAGKTTDWAMKFTAPGADGVELLAIKAPSHLKRGEALSIQVAETKGNSPAGAIWSGVLSESVDGHWRSLATLKPGPDADAGFRLFEASTTPVRQILAVVKIEVHLAGKLIAKGQAEVVVTPPGSAWDDFEVFMWPVDGLPYLRTYEDGLMQRIGSTGVMDTDWSNAGRRMRWARAGLRILPHDVDVRPLHIRPYEFGQIAKKYQDGDKNALIRPTSFADPKFWEAAKKRVTDAANALAPFHIPAYVLCDEPSLTSYREAFDFDFHPANIALFQKSLETQFKNVATLNDALGIKAESFDKIMPPTTDEAKKSGTWGLWNAWRAHNDTVMADAYKTYRDTLRAVDPQARISISGTQTANPYDGFDWGKLSPYFDAMSGYGYGEQERTRLSFYPGSETMRNATPAGYGNSGKGVQYQLWAQLCNHGAGHVLFWWVSFRNPDLTFCQSARDYAVGFAELEGGIGRQYMQGKRYTSPVAIQYSMNSMRAAWATDQFGAYERATQDAVDALVAAGFDPVFISDEEIAAGELVKRAYKAVVLPYPLSLGQGKKAGGLDVTGGLAKFTAGGGVAMAMAEPQFDEFLQKVVPDAAVWSKVQKFDAVKDKLSATLAAAGAKPWVKVTRADGSAVPGLSITVHKLSGVTPAYIVTLLRKPVGQKEVIGADGVLTYVPDPNAGNEIEECTVDLSALGRLNVSALRTGEKVVGADGKVALKLPSGGATPLVLLPYTLHSLDATAKTADGGLQVRWQLRQVAVDDQPDPAFVPHVVHVEVPGLDGKPDRAFTCNANVDAAGAGSVTFPLAVEDAGREFKVTVKDILTGTTAVATVKAP